MIEATRKVVLRDAVAGQSLPNVQDGLVEVHHMQLTLVLCFAHYPSGMVCHVVMHGLAPDMGDQMAVLVTDMLAQWLEMSVQQFGMVPDQGLVVVDMVDEVPVKVAGTFGQGSGMVEQTQVLAFDNLGLPVEVAFGPAQVDQEVILYLEGVDLDLMLEPK